MQRLDLGSFHVAYLDPFTGSGVLVLPVPSADVWLGHESIHEAAWSSVLRTLDALGWEPSESDDGTPAYDGTTYDGRPILGLYGREPIISNPTLAECAEASSVLLSLATCEEVAR